MATEWDIEQERQINERVHKLIDDNAKDLAYYWHYGDGEGGYFIEEVVTRLRKAGYKVDNRIYGFCDKPVNPNPRKNIKASVRKMVMERDAYRCKHCESYVDLCIDHIHPVSRGGTNDPDNLQTLCRACNGRKGAKVE